LKTPDRQENNTSLKQGVAVPPGFNNSFCINTLLPAIQQAYVKAYEVKYGQDRKEWSLLGRLEFADLGAFQLPKNLQLKATIEIKQNLFFWERDKHTHLPMGFLLETDEAQVLVFRGTLSAFEWYHDVLIQQVPLEGHQGKVHNGFRTLYQSLLAGDWQQHLTNKPLIITGHSLGASLATLMAPALQQYNPEVYLFGSPRVGDREFATYYNQLIPTTYRVENAFDLIPELPPEELFVLRENYAHVGKRVYVHAGINEIQQYNDLKNREVLLGHFPSVYLKALSLLNA